MDIQLKWDMAWALQLDRHSYQVWRRLLNASVAIGKTILTKGGILHQDYQSFGPKQNWQDT